MTTDINHFKQDVNEPQSIIPMLATVVPLIVQPLNVQGYADYMWKKIDGKEKQVERKTWGELLANVDKVEEQLQRHLTKNPDIELVFMLEGIVVQDELGTTIINSTNNNRIFAAGHRYAARLNRIYSWLYEVSNFLTVIQTTTLRESSIALAAMYSHDQRSDHKTLRRHIKQVANTPNHMVTTLMGASPGLGDKRASSLITMAGTAWHVWSAGYCEHSAYKDKYDFTSIDGIGKGILDNLYRSIGRPDV